VKEKKKEEGREKRGPAVYEADFHHKTALMAATNDFGSNSLHVLKYRGGEKKEGGDEGKKTSGDGGASKERLCSLTRGKKKREEKKRRKRRKAAKRRKLGSCGVIRTARCSCFLGFNDLLSILDKVGREKKGKKKGGDG